MVRGKNFRRELKFVFDGLIGVRHGNHDPDRVGEVAIQEEGGGSRVLVVLLVRRRE